MEAKDIWLLLAGAALGFVGSVLATFAAPSIGSVFGKLKSGFIERSKSNALASYVVVRDLHTGKRDKYLYAINGWASINVLILGGLMAGGLGFITRRLVGGPIEPIHPVRTLLALIVGILIVLLVLRHLLTLFLTLNRVDNFDHYRAELLKRWPDIQLPE